MVVTAKILNWRLDWNYSFVNASIFLLSAFVFPFFLTDLPTPFMREKAIENGTFYEDGLRKKIKWLWKGILFRHNQSVRMLEQLRIFWQSYNALDPFSMNLVACAITKAQPVIIKSESYAYPKGDNYIRITKKIILVSQWTEARREKSVSVTVLLSNIIWPGLLEQSVSLRDI